MILISGQIFDLKGDKAWYGGSKTDAITSHFGLPQLINEPKHVFVDSSFCIDLIFTSQSKLVMGFEVHSLLHQNCYHQEQPLEVFCKKRCS